MSQLAQTLRGILSVLQTPFTPANQIDFDSYSRLIRHAHDAKVGGLLVPVVASEVAFLSAPERVSLVRHVRTIGKNQVPVVVGASANDPEECRPHLELAEEISAAAFLVAVPRAFYSEPAAIFPFFRTISKMSSLPMIIQDFQLNGPGLSIEQIQQLRDELPNFMGIKIETQPAGPKYTAVREACGPDFFIAGGWAVTQMLEALDRGVNAMIPESAMLPVYQAILNAYQQGHRDLAQKIFRRLLPVLSFTNQEVGVSIAFFKKLLVRKKIFRHEGMRWPDFHWDCYNEKIAAELIDLYLQLENEVLTQPEKFK
jgi:4-hydroxy-tetrahydrodipicolinate synthase